MITITIPLLPTVIAAMFLVAFIFVVVEEGGGFAAGFVPLIAAAFSFFLFHGVMSMFGGY